MNLITSKEVYVIDCWEPMVFVREDKGVNVVYADPKEGHLLWAMAAYIVNNPKRSRRRPKETYDLLDFMLGPWYGAKITLRGLHDQTPGARIRQGTWRRIYPEEARKIAEIRRTSSRKFEQGGTWQNRWPTQVEVYEEEWQRFKAA